MAHHVTPAVVSRFLASTGATPTNNLVIAQGIQQSKATNPHGSMLGEDSRSLVTRGGQPLYLPKATESRTGRGAEVREVKTIELSKNGKSAANNGTIKEEKRADIPRNEKPMQIPGEMLVTEGAKAEEKKVEEEAGWLSNVNPGVRLRLKEQLTVVL